MSFITKVCSRLLLIGYFFLVGLAGVTFSISENLHHLFVVAMFCQTICWLK